MFSETELALVFQICDPEGQGFIRARDLVRVSAHSSPISPSASQGIDQVIALLHLQPNERLDFDEFCARVNRAWIHSPQGSGSFTLEGSGERSQVQVPKVEGRPGARRSLFSHEAHSAYDSPPIVDDVHKCLKTIQRQILELRDAQYDSRSEVLGLMRENAKQHEDDLGRKILQLQNVYEEKLLVEQKHMEDLMRIEEREHSAGVEKIEEEKKTLLGQLSGLKDHIGALNARLELREAEIAKLRSNQETTRREVLALSQSKKEDSETSHHLKMNNLVLEQKIRSLEERQSLEFDNNVRIRHDFEAERERLDEERLALSFEKASFASDKDELRAVFHTILQQIMDQRVVSEQSNRLSHDHYQERPNYDMAVEMVESDHELIQKVENLTVENEELKGRVQHLMGQKGALEEQIGRTRLELDNFRQSFRTLEAAKSEESRTLIQQFTGALNNSKMKSRLKELEEKLTQTQLKLDTANGSHADELNALRTALRQSRSSLERLQLETEAEIRDLKVKLRETESELKWVREAAGMIKASHEEKRCLSLLVDDICNQHETIIHRLQVLEGHLPQSSQCNLKGSPCPDVCPRND